MVRSLALFALTLPFASAASAGELAYVEASSELDGGRPATYAYNLIDGKETTAWCSKPGPGPHTLVFGFDAPLKVTHLAIVVGAIKGEALDESKARVKTLAISDGSIRREIQFKDVPGLQEVKLEPPAEANRLIIDVVGMKAGKTSEAPVCIGELALKSGKKELTGATIYQQLRSLNTPARRLLHPWVDEPSAPERTLLFSLDGSFRYTYEPLLEGKPVKLKGTWTAMGKAVTLEVKGKKYKLKSRITRIDDGEETTEELSLSGDAPDPSLNASFRRAPVRYE